MSDSETGAPELVEVRSAHRLDDNALKDYLDAQGLLDGELTIRQFQGGQSNPTFLLTLGEGQQRRRYVLRKQPPGDILPSAHRVDREYKVMAALNDVSGVPVPTMRAYCDDVRVIGTPFYVMDFVAGRVFGNPALPALAPDERRRIHHGMIDTMAALHSVDIDAVGLADFGRPKGYFERQVKLWRKQYEASAQTVDSNMEALGAWLTDHVPLDSPPAIAHGDYRIGNLLMADDLSQADAILDWELATLGHPLADLAHACMPYHLPPDVPGLAGVEGLDLDARGIPDEATQVARYRAARGIGEIDDWPVFVAFALYRMAAILQGVYARALAGNASNEDALQVGGHAGLMAERGRQVMQSFESG